MHVTDFLKQSDTQEITPVVVLTGGQRHLKQAAVKALCRRVLGEADESAASRFVGRETELKTVADELLTVSMWGGRRLVLVEEADEFVSKHRAALEKYCEKPAKKSVLALDVKSWPKTTRLAKIVAKSGLELDGSELKGAQLAKWIGDTARETYGRPISREAAQLLTELAGDDLGLLDQELAKLSAYVGARGRIDLDDVKTLVGGWKTETTWAMTDAVRDGDLGHALNCLDQLLTAGEAPQKILGGITYVFRKFAHATELSRQKIPLDAALRQAGVFPRDLPAATAYLRRLGRPRAERILTRLLHTDAGLKGTRRLPERMQLEELLLELSGAK